MINLEVGKKYLTREGKKVTIVHKHSKDNIEGQPEGGGMEIYYPNGVITHARQDPRDIVAEWVDPHTAAQHTLNLPKGYAFSQAGKLEFIDAVSALIYGQSMTKTAWDKTPKCICDSRDLFNFGCKCGAFVREKQA